MTLTRRWLSIPRRKPPLLPLWTVDLTPFVRGAYRLVPGKVPTAYGSNVGANHERAASHLNVTHALQPDLQSIHFEYLSFDFECENGRL